MAVPAHVKAVAVSGSSNLLPDPKTLRCDHFGKRKNREKHRAPKERLEVILLFTFSTPVRIVTVSTGSVSNLFSW